VFLLKSRGRKQVKKEEKESPFPLFSLERAAARSLGSLPVVAGLSYLFFKYLMKIC